ncbi:MAG: serine hydrolase [Verrucomicrobia bacterium]|nr:serine hydrolase [Verrucomicrobiota bacterium]
MKLHAAVVCFLLGLASLGAADAPGPLALVLQSLVDKRLVAGAVALVADKEKVLSLETAGWADTAAKRKMRPDCLFWIASQSKPMAATALMMLVDEGKVSLDDSVEKYLPEFKEQWLVAERDSEHVLLKKPKQPIRVRHLLSHTSGMLYKTPAEQPTLDVLPLDARMHTYVMSPLQFEPGTRHLYANAGINTAARIVELVSGRPYERFLAERLLTPLGMKDTTFWPTAGQLKRLAKSYKPTATKNAFEEAPIPQLRYPLDDRTRCVQPAGGLFSTAGDLLNFYRMILNGGVFAGRRILSEQAVRQMTSKQTGDLPQAYGFGFDVTRGIIGHGGTFGTHSSFDATRRFISIFLIQYAGPPADMKRFLSAFHDAARATCSVAN